MLGEEPNDVNPPDCCRYSAGSYTLMLAESSGIFIGIRPVDVRLALKLGPDVEVLL